MRLRPRSCSQRRWRSSSCAPGWTQVTTQARGRTPSRRSHASRSRLRRPSGTRRPCRRQAFWVVQAGDTFGVISTKTGVPVATIERLNPNVVLDLALHRREDPPAVTRALLLAAARCRAAAVSRHMPPRREVDGSAYIVQDARTGEVLAASRSARAAADRVDHEADDGARDARAPQAHATSSGSTRAPPRSASRPSVCVAASA